MVKGVEKLILKTQEKFTIRQLIFNRENLIKAII
jgi:hypothetical protein